MTKYLEIINTNLTQIMKLLDPENQYPFPKVKIVQRARAPWAGICIPKIIGVNEDDTIKFDITILIQKLILQDKTIFYNVLAHECCHYIDLLKINDEKCYIFTMDNLLNHESHGESFQILAKKINNDCGNLNVTSKYANFNLEDIEKLVLLREIDNIIEYSYTCRPSKKQIIRLARCFIDNNGEYKLIATRKFINNNNAVIDRKWVSSLDEDFQSFFRTLWIEEEDILEKFLRTELKPSFFDNIEMFKK